MFYDEIKKEPSDPELRRFFATGPTGHHSPRTAVIVLGGSVVAAWLGVAATAYGVAQLARPAAQLFSQSAGPTEKTAVDQSKPVLVFAAASRDVIQKYVGQTAKTFGSGLVSAHGPLKPKATNISSRKSGSIDYTS